MARELKTQFILTTQRRKLKVLVQLVSGNEVYEEREATIEELVVLNREILEENEIDFFWLEKRGGNTEKEVGK